jgi:hypothetical protein
MKYIPFFIFILTVLFLVVWAWIEGIDHMHKNHPDYKGDDLFGKFDEDDKNQIG